MGTFRVLELAKSNGGRVLMDADSDEGWIQVPLSVADGQDEYNVAAIENASLEVQHETSRLQEQAISDEIEALEAQRRDLQMSAVHDRRKFRS